MTEENKQQPSSPDAPINKQMPADALQGSLSNRSIDMAEAYEAQQFDEEDCGLGDEDR